MRKTTIIFSLLLGLMLAPFLSNLAYAGFGFGLPGIVKEKVEKIDKKVEKKKAEEAINHAPNTPSNPSPANGATNQPSNFDMTWSGGDPDAGDTVVYSGYFGTDNPPTEFPLSDRSDPVANAQNLPPNTTYYWQIVATDNHGASTTGPVWSFTTGSSTNNSPNAPSNPSPSDGATNQSRSNLNVTWSGGDPDAGDTVIYTRYLGTDNPPTEYVVDLPNPSFSCGGLSPNTTWYWQVVTTDNHGASTSGPIWSFTTGN